MSQRTTPPFRADHVGSLLRPKSLLEARARRARGEISPAEVRSLDAIHLASALSLGSDLGVIVAYDERLLDAARTQGLPTSSPS